VKQVSQDLRSFIEAVRREYPGEIVDVYREVKPQHETTAILAKLENGHRSPLLFFHHLAGCDFPLASNVCGSLNRLGLALGCKPGEISERYAQACNSLIRPRLTTQAPVQETVVEGDQLDLNILPHLVYHEQDTSHPYITAAIVVARDPHSGESNLSYHRLMISGRNTTAIYMEPGKHLHSIYQKYERTDQPMPIAAFIGAHPLWSLGALFSGAQEIEEYEIIGGLQGEPLDVVECVTQASLQVPAAAEFVLEGVVPSQKRIEEGPFGEFTGYSIGALSTPVFDVQAMTCRRDPIFQDIASGYREHLILPVPSMEHHLLGLARKCVPAVQKVKMVAPLSLVVTLDKSDDSQPRSVIEALLKGDIYTKLVIVLDSGANMGDLREVLTSVALQVQPDRDVFIFTDQPGTPLDPSCDSLDGQTSKVGIDATRPLSPRRPIHRNVVPAHILDPIDLSELLGQG